MVPSRKSAVILCEPIYWRCGATDLSRKERGKVVPSKEYGGPVANPISLAASTRTGSVGRHEEKWFLRKQYRNSGGAFLLGLGVNRGDEEKWFRKENVPANRSSLNWKVFRRARDKAVWRKT